MSKSETTTPLKKFIDRKITLLRKFEAELSEDADQDEDWDGLYAEWEGMQ